MHKDTNEIKTQNNIEIKKASKAEYKDLYDLTVEFEKYNQNKSTRPHEHFMEEWEKYFEEEIKDSLNSEHAFNFITYSEDKPAGYIYVRYCPHCDKTIIEELFVHQDFQKRGISKALMQKAMDIAKLYDSDLTLEVYDWNKEAYEYYLKNGFKLDSYSMVYEPKGD